VGSPTSALGGVSRPSGGLGDVRLVLDTSALLGYAANRPGVIELISR
jgi:hypothetical protein